MNTEMVVRAWEDPIYRASLAPEILASLPANPAGSSVDDLDRVELSDVIGAEHKAWALKRTVVCTVIGTITLGNKCQCC